jgi:hypothetical protein
MIIVFDFIRQEAYVDEHPHDVHDYLSTACWHRLHSQCRKTCKFCGRPCQCECHPHEASES